MVFQRLWIWRTRVALSTLRSVDLVPNRGGALLLRMRGTQYRTSRYLPILALTDHVHRSQSAQVLTLLAEQLEQWCPPKAREQTPDFLRKQAKYVGNGRSPETSPLAAQVTHTMTRLAKGGGAVGGGSSLG